MGIFIIMIKIKKLWFSLFVRKFGDINSNIIPFFNKYNIIGVKCKDFIDWSEAAKIIELKDHLTGEGFKKICKIKENMNSYRI